MIKEQFVAVLNMLKSPLKTLREMTGSQFYISAFIIVILKNSLGFNNVGKITQIILTYNSAVVKFIIIPLMVIGFSIFGLFLWSFVIREVLKIFDRVIGFKKIVNIVGYSHVIQIAWYSIYWIVWLSIPGEFRAYIAYSGEFLALVLMFLPFTIVAVCVYGQIIYGSIVASEKIKYDETLPEEVINKMKTKQSNWNVVRIFIILMIMAGIGSSLQRKYFGEKPSIVKKESILKKLWPNK